MATDLRPQIATIGVYGYDLEAFLSDLRRHDVVRVADLRQRRGVRGPEYSWANARRLIQALHDKRIGYEHHRELAPTSELRELQYAEDARRRVGKRSRVELAPAYRERYVSEILDVADLDEFMRDLPLEGVTALLCVERDPEACHRSLVAERLERLGAVVVHLRPS